MPDTPRTRETLLQDFADNAAGRITAQKLRDFLASVSVTTQHTHNPSEIIQCDFWKSNAHHVVLTQDTTLEMLNVSAGQEVRVTLQQDAQGGWHVEWWPNIRWQYGCPNVDYQPDSLTTYSFVKLASGEYLQYGYSPSLAHNETPSGSIDGVNPTFTLSRSPIPGSVHLHKNGLLQKAGAENDYTISGAVITLNQDALPSPGDTLIAHYAY